LRCVLSHFSQKHAQEHITGAQAHHRSTGMPMRSTHRSCLLFDHSPPCSLLVLVGQRGPRISRRSRDLSALCCLQRQLAHPVHSALGSAQYNIRRQIDDMTCVCVCRCDRIGCWSSMTSQQSLPRPCSSRPVFGSPISVRHLFGKCLLPPNDLCTFVRALHSPQSISSQ
jgi:hypothetical protein